MSIYQRNDSVYFVIMAELEKRPGGMTLKELEDVISQHRLPQFKISTVQPSLARLKQFGAVECEPIMLRGARATVRYVLVNKDAIPVNMLVTSRLNGCPGRKRPERRNPVTVPESVTVTDVKIQGQEAQAPALRDVIHSLVSDTPKQEGVDAILDERGARYGKFEDHARVTQAIKNILYGRIAERMLILSNDQREALDMIAHKLGRIVNGDQNYADSWVDIAGYAKLVADRLEGRAR